jgi:predicted NBD/HSP70 family sugar kinase
MGSSEATGYINHHGLFTGDYTALAYVPVDYNPGAAVDIPSQDIGCGALYFSQQAVNRLAPRVGFSFPEDMHLRERLKIVQEKADGGDEGACSVFSTIGVYLGYTLAFYHELIPFENVLVLGRVSSGRGGELVMRKTEDVLKSAFPELAEGVSLFVPDEESRRVGQAVAAASLPRLK